MKTFSILFQIELIAAMKYSKERYVDYEFGKYLRYAAAVHAFSYIVTNVLRSSRSMLTSEL